MGKNVSLKKIAKKMKEGMLCSSEHEHGQPPNEDSPAMREPGDRHASTSTPRGCFTVYVGEERRRTVVPTAFLSHPLLKILMEKSYEEEITLGFDGKKTRRLVVPCTVSAFEEALNAVECRDRNFDFGYQVDEFI